LRAVYLFLFRFLLCFERVLEVWLPIFWRLVFFNVFRYLRRRVERLEPPPGDLGGLSTSFVKSIGAREVNDAGGVDCAELSSINLTNVCAALAACDSESESSLLITLPFADHGALLPSFNSTNICAALASITSLTESGVLNLLSTGNSGVVNNESSGHRFIGTTPNAFPDPAASSPTFLADSGAPINILLCCFLADSGDSIFIFVCLYHAILFSAAGDGGSSFISPSLLNFDILLKLSVDPLFF
jgi:hypothetical protein